MGDPRHLRFAGASPHFARDWTQEDGGDWSTRRRKGRANNSQDDVDNGDEIDRCLGFSFDELDDFWSDVRLETSTALSQLKDHQINALVHELRLKKAQEDEIDSVHQVEVPVLELPAIVIRRYHDGGDASSQQDVSQVSGYDILLPGGSAPIFFHALVMSGCVALGMDEACALRSDAGVCNFPHEYPDSIAGQEIWSSLKAEQKRINPPKKKTKKRAECSSFIPPHVNINWLNLFPPSSSSVMVARNMKYVAPLFELPFPTPPVPILVPVRVYVHGKGVPRCGKAVCIPLHISTTLPLTQRTRELVLKSSIHSTDRNDDSDNSDEEDGVDVKVDMFVIGHVTSGGYSAARGCGFGIAMCTVQGLQLLLTRQIELLTQDDSDDGVCPPLQILRANKAQALIASVEQPQQMLGTEVPHNTFHMATSQLSSVHNASVGLCCD